jgi:type I restriction enzyme R subunit
VIISARLFREVWDIFPEATVPRDGSHDAFITAMTILRDEDGAEKQFDVGYRNLRVMYEALQPDEQLRDFIRPYAWLTKLYLLYRKKFYPVESRSIEATEEDAARTRELIRDHIDVEMLETEFPTYVLDEHFLTKLKDKKPDAKALDIEAMLSSELRIRLDQDESFRPAVGEAAAAHRREARRHAGGSGADRRAGKGDRRGARRPSTR